MFINTDDCSKGVTASLRFHVAHQTTGSNDEFSQIRKTHVGHIRIWNFSFVRKHGGRVSIMCYPLQAAATFYKGWLAHVANVHERFESKPRLITATCGAYNGRWTHDTEGVSFHFDECTVLWTSAFRDALVRRPRRKPLCVLCARLTTTCFNLKLTTFKCG